MRVTHGAYVRPVHTRFGTPRQLQKRSWQASPLHMRKPLRAVLDKLAAIQMLDVHFPTTDGRALILSRYTELNTDQKLLLKRLKLDLPSQPTAHHHASGAARARRGSSPLVECSGDFRDAIVDFIRFLPRIGKVGLAKHDD